MKSTRLLPLVIAGVIVASCGGDDKSATNESAATSSSVAEITTTSPATTTTSTTIPVTTAASTSTTSSTTSTTSSTTTSTTLAPGAELVLRPNGIGDAAFGVDPDGTVAYVTSIIGKPTIDTGWVDPLSVGACPGTELRQVTWNDLVLLFSDESPFATGRRNFFAYTYGPYPSVVINPADDFGGPNFLINDGLYGFLSGVDPTDTVTSILGGQGCGE